MPVSRSVERIDMPSVRQAMTSICLSRERIFMTGPVRMLRTKPEALEKQLQLLYIYQNGHCLGSSPGLVIGDRHRSNGDGPIAWFGAPDSDRHFLTGKGGCPTVRRAPRDCRLRAACTGWWASTRAILFAPPPA